MQRKKYGKEPGITLHRWVVKAEKDGQADEVFYVDTKERAVERCAECIAKGAKVAQIFKAIHEFEEAWKA